MRAGVLVALLLLSPGIVEGSCIAAPGCYNLTGVVSKCEEARIASRRFLRVRVIQPIVDITNCGRIEPFPKAEAKENYRSLVYDQGDYLVDVRVSVECPALIGSTLNASVEFLCCDTVPAEGLCKSERLFLVQKSN